MKVAKTIKQDTIALLSRKRPLTYEGIVAEVQKRHPECKTSVKTIQWYASRLRAAGEVVNVKLLKDRRDWANRPATKPTEAVDH